MSAGRICQLAVALVAIACARISSATPIVSISPSSTNVIVGDTFSLNVTISNVTDLYAFQFDLIFNPAVIHASGSGATEGGFLGTGGSTVFSPGTIDNVLGSISSVTDTLVGPVAGVTTVGPAVLASANFVAIGASVSPISLFTVLLLDSNLDIIDFQPVAGAVNVRAVPEPATMMLIAIGLAGVFRLKGNGWTRSKGYPWRL